MTMPSQEWWDGMLSELRKYKRAFDAAEDDATRLSCGVSGLTVVMRYLMADEEVRNEGLVRPLAAIENALYDRARGANPPILKHRAPEVGGRPTLLVSATVQGTLAFALEVMIRGGLMGREPAEKWVAEEARRQGVRSEDGGAITARQIGDWREGISRDRALAGARETFDRSREMPRYKWLLAAPKKAPKRREVAEALARGVIETIADLAPRSAPKGTHRAAKA